MTLRKSRKILGEPVVAPLVEPASELTIDEVRRYSRHLIIPDVGMRPSCPKERLPSP